MNHMMKFPRTQMRFLAGMCALFFLTATGVQAQTSAPSTPPVTEKAKAARPALSKQNKALLYELKSEDKNAPVAYLFASIHIAKRDFYPLPAVVRSAYKKSQVLVVETDVSDEAMNKKMVNALSYAAPDHLQAHVQAATWETLQAMTGPMLEQFQPYKPAMVAMGLTVSVGMQQGYEPEQGLDLHYLRQAKVDHKMVVELEGAAFQGEAISQLSDEQGDAMLASTLASFKQGTMAEELNRMAEAWRAGDARQLEQLFQTARARDAGSEKLYQLLMDQRHPQEAEKISDLMKQGKRLFIVMSAAHLQGEESLLNHLRKRKIQVKTMQ